MIVTDKPSPASEFVINWNEIPKFVVAGVPYPEFAGLRTTVWLDWTAGCGFRPTTRWDFATRSVNCETIRHMMNEAKSRFGDDGYKWRVRVRAGTRSIVE